MCPKETMTTPSYDWLFSVDQNVAINMSGVLYLKIYKTDSGKALIRAHMNGTLEPVTVKVCDGLEEAMITMKDISKVLIRAGNKIYTVK